MKKFRIGAGLQNFHIRTPLLSAQQRCDRIRVTGVKSGRILRFSFGSGPESKFCEKPGLDPESLFHFGSNRSPCGHVFKFEE